MYVFINLSKEISYLVEVCGEKTQVFSIYVEAITSRYERVVTTERVVKIDIDFISLLVSNL